MLCASRQLIAVVKQGPLEKAAGHDHSATAVVASWSSSSVDVIGSEGHHISVMCCRGGFVGVE